MEHDLYYGLKRRPFLLIEQNPTQQDWNNYWANGELNASSRNYIDKLLAYYKVIARQHVNIDLVAPTDDLSQYKLVLWTW